MQKDVCFSPDAPRAYLLPVQAHGSLRQARDQLRLYAQMVDPCSDTPDEILVNSMALADLFDRIAVDLDNVIGTLSPTSS